MGGLAIFFGFILSVLIFLPLTQELKDFHAGKIDERAKAENRKASFQMVIDDVYSIGKGRLVGRPRY